MADQDFIQRIPLFSRLHDSEFQELASQIEEAPYKKGEYIFHEGDPAEYFHIVKEGSVKCVKSSPDGREFTLKYLMPGDLFCCEAAVFEGSTHPGCAKVFDRATIFRIKKQAYFDILRRNPDAALDIINYLGHRLNEAQENAKTFAFDRAEQRIASVLVTMAQKTGVKHEDGIHLAVRLTRRDLGDMAGLTLETATRVMSRFKKQGLITGNAKCLVIQQISELQKLAKHSPTLSLSNPSPAPR